MGGGATPSTPFPVGSRLNTIAAMASLPPLDAGTTLASAEEGGEAVVDD